MTQASRSRAGVATVALVALLICLFPLGLIVVVAAGVAQQDCAGAAGAPQPAASQTAQRTIPADWLPLLRDAGRQYGISWTVLAAIASIETDFGRSTLPGVHSGANAYGAAGPMQFGIGGAAGETWQHVTGRPISDVYDPRYAVPAAAKYLRENLNDAGGDLRQAIFGYNHATWYVNQVLARAREYGQGHYSLAPSAGAAAVDCPAGPAGENTPPGDLPTGTRMFDGKPVAAWIVPIISWARAHGWAGQVSSGYRTPAEQIAAANNYGLQHYGPAGPLGSNHVRTDYPGGAIDVTAAAQLNEVLERYPNKPRLVWAGPTIGDWVHFSANGH